MNRRGTTGCPLRLVSNLQRTNRARHYLSIVCSGAVGVKDSTLIVDVSSIKEFVELISGFTTVGHVPPHCIEVTNTP
jgi:hypothetical protein